MKVITKNKIAKIAAQYLRPCGKGFVLDASCCGSITPDEGEYIHDFIIKHKLKVGVEMGTGTGYSSLYFGSALKSFCTIDNGGIALTLNRVYGEVKKMWREMHKQMGFKKGILIETDRDDCPLSNIDFVFIDGDHTADSPLLDFEAFYPHMADRCFVFWHDISYPDVARCADEAKQKGFSDIDIISSNNGDTWGLGVQIRL